MSPHAPTLKQIRLSLQDISQWPGNKFEDSMMSYNAHVLLLK
jgi:hypothetical protein